MLRIPRNFVTTLRPWMTERRGQMMTKLTTQLRYWVHTLSRRIKQFIIELCQSFSFSIAFYYQLLKFSYSVFPSSVLKEGLYMLYLSHNWFLIYIIFRTTHWLQIMARMIFFWGGGSVIHGRNFNAGKPILLEVVISKSRYYGGGGERFTYLPAMPSTITLYYI